jgi:hypothetical protein
LASSMATPAARWRASAPATWWGPTADCCCPPISHCSCDIQRLVGGCTSRHFTCVVST